MLQCNLNTLVTYDQNIISNKTNVAESLHYFIFKIYFVSTQGTYIPYKSFTRIILLSFSTYLETKVCLYVILSLCHVKRILILAAEKCIQIEKMCV